MAGEPNVAGPRPRKFRWTIGLGILLVASAVTAISWNVHAGDLTLQVMWLYFVWPATVFALLLWWTFLSGLRWKSRLIGLGALVCAVALFFTVRKFDGFDGAMIPRFSFRWSSQEPDEAYFASLEDGERSDRSREYIKALKQRPPAGTAHRDGETVSAGEHTAEELLQIQSSRNGTPDPRDLTAAVGVLSPALFDSSEQGLKLTDWPRFRGPLMDGVVREKGLRFDWTPDDPPRNLWNEGQKVGKGWSSFAVVDGALAITQEQRGEQETVVCYDFATGTPIWTHADEARFSRLMGGEGPRATPTVVGRRVYTLGATGILNCLDLGSGRPLWQRNILKDAGAENLSWGMAGSPLVSGGLLFVNPGKGSGKAVIAYNRFNGDVVWASGNERAGYSSPVLHRIRGTLQLLIFNGTGLFSYDPNTGRKLWSFPWKTENGINVALPIVRDNEVFISSGYGKGCAKLEIRLRDGEWSVHEEWTRPFRLKFGDAVFKDGYIYGLDETVLKCIRFRDGRIMWRRRGESLGPGGSYGFGQLLLAGETLIITAENGFVSFVTADHNRPRYLGGFQALNRTTFGRTGKGWNQPVISRGRLLLRNEFEAACYDLRGK